MESTLEGWIVDDLQLYRMVVEQAPPRPHTGWRLFCEDVRSRRVLAIWAVGVALCAAAMITGWWGLLGGGLGAFLFWFRLFRMAVRKLRDSPVVSGVIEGKLPANKHRSFWTIVHVQLADGRMIEASIPPSLLDYLLGIDEQFEILVLDTRGSGFSMVVAVRANSRDSLTVS